MEGAEDWAKEHWALLAGGIVGLIVLWVIVSKLSGGSQTTLAPQDTSGVSAAAGIQNAQIAAGVADNQTMAAQTVALATVAGQTQAAVAASTAATQQAYYGAATAIATTNANAYTHVFDTVAAENVANNQTAAGEFSDLAALVASFGSQTNNSNIVGQNVLASGLFNELFNHQSALDTLASNSRPAISASLTQTGNIALLTGQPVNLGTTPATATTDQTSSLNFGVGALH